MSFLCHLIPVDARKVEEMDFKIMTIFVIFRLSSPQKQNEENVYCKISA